MSEADRRAQHVGMIAAPIDLDTIVAWYVANASRWLELTELDNAA